MICFVYIFNTKLRIYIIIFILFIQYNIILYNTKFRNQFYEVYEVLIHSTLLRFVISFVSYIDTYIYIIFFLIFFRNNLLPNVILYILIWHVRCVIE